MTNCAEFPLDEVMAITAIPVTDYNIGTYSWQLTPTIAVADFNPNYDNSITIGAKLENGRTLIPIIRATGKAKDSESDSVAGRQHTVTVQCEVDDRDKAMWDYLLTLERTPSHLRLTFRNMTHAFVAATRDSYLCEVERNGAKTSVSFRVYNLMGIQLIEPID